ncbi:MAG: hypothetical protein M3Z25_13655 [Actinomycetota bacterium]|nr:hypothetical protein [Actinomycetota bacterium]
MKAGEREDKAADHEPGGSPGQARPHLIHTNGAGHPGADQLFARRANS